MFRGFQAPKHKPETHGAELIIQDIGTEYIIGFISFKRYEMNVQDCFVSKIFITRKS